MRTFRILPFFLALAVTAALAAPAAATTYVMVSDADLARQAAVIAVARALDSAPAAKAGLPATDHRFEILEAVKGAAPGEILSVRVPGGEGADGIGYRVWGAPRFTPGARALLFLAPDAGGGYHVLHLLLGAFHLMPGEGGREVAFRDLSGATEVAAPGPGGELKVVASPTDIPRDLNAFLDWLRAGAAAPADYFLEPDPALLSRFTYLTGSDGHPIRWFLFESNQNVSFQADSTGQPGLAGGGFSEVQTALAAWTNDAGSNIRYTWSGTTTSRATSCAPPSQVGKIVFDDPFNEISDTYSCGSGGVLGQGGPCFQLNLLPWNGDQFHPAIDAFVITNDGLGCFFQSSGSRAAEELFAHELGHTLGLGHSGDGQALMYAFIHNDGRGAGLRADDRAGAAALYGSGGGPPPPPSPPAAPSNLGAAVLSASQIRLTWQDNANNETEYLLERRTTGSFQQIATLGANSTAYTNGGLATATRYEYRVRARNAAGSSAYSNLAAATTGGPPPSLPAPPTGLVAQTLSSSRIRLSWRDNASDETSFRVERRNLGGTFQQIAELGADSNLYTDSGRLPATTYEYRVRAANAAGFSAYSNLASTTTASGAGDCVPDADTLCLLGGLVEVEARWRNQRTGKEGLGRAIPSTRKSGYFWFFSGTNVELVVKALDGRSTNGHIWFFYGGLSDVEYWIRVLRTDTGEEREYHNPPGEICGEGDITALGDAAGLPGGVLEATDGLHGSVFAWPAPLEEPARASVAAGACAPAAGTLCLLDGRLEVRVEWTNQRNGGQGTGGAIPWRDRTGFFWFFDPANVELVVKALDGRTTNGHIWFFYGGLSDVFYRLRVKDTVSGVTRVYENPAGEICGQGDVTAFPAP